MNGIFHLIICVSAFDSDLYLFDITCINFEFDNLTNSSFTLWSLSSDNTDSVAVLNLICYDESMLFQESNGMII